MKPKIPTSQEGGGGGLAAVPVHGKSDYLTHGAHFFDNAENLGEITIGEYKYFVRITRNGFEVTHGEGGLRAGFEKSSINLILFHGNSQSEISLAFESPEKATLKIKVGDVAREYLGDLETVMRRAHDDSRAPTESKELATFIGRLTRDREFSSRLAAACTLMAPSGFNPQIFGTAIGGRRHDVLSVTSMLPWHCAVLGAGCLASLATPVVGDEVICAIFIKHCSAAA